MGAAETKVAKGDRVHICMLEEGYTCQMGGGGDDGDSDDNDNDNGGDNNGGSDGGGGGDDKDNDNDKDNADYNDGDAIFLQCSEACNIGIEKETRLPIFKTVLARQRPNQAAELTISNKCS